MDIHKWSYYAVQGLGAVCLWYELSKLLAEYVGLYTGVIISMFFIGWAYTYKDEKKD